MGKRKTNKKISVITINTDYEIQIRQRIEQVSKTTDSQEKNGIGKHSK